MNEFLQTLQDVRKVSVWGAGYLGYTAMLELQASGFFINLYDFNVSRLSDLENNKYPADSQRLAWSNENMIPLLNLSLLRLCGESMREMFDTNVHIIGFPFRGFRDETYNSLERLAELFNQHADKVHSSLVIFLAGELPGAIEASFIRKLNRDLSAKLDFCGVFRDDWLIEEFLRNKKNNIVIFPESKKAEERAVSFYGIFEKKCDVIYGIKNGELYETAKNTLYHTIATFFNQLAVAYPLNDVSSMAGYILKNFSMDYSPCFGMDGYKVPLSSQSLISGSDYPDEMPIIKDLEVYSLGLCIKYADYLARKNISSVLFLGFTSRGNVKRIEISPTAVMAEYLCRSGITVYIDDPLFTKDEIAGFIPKAIKVDIFAEKLSFGAIIIMSNHRRYRHLNKETIKSTGIWDADLIIDNTSSYKNYPFNSGALYHCMGDGNLDILS